MTFAFKELNYNTLMRARVKIPNSERPSREWYMLFYDDEVATFRFIRYLYIEKRSDYNIVFRVKNQIIDKDHLKFSDRWLNNSSLLSIVFKRLCRCDIDTLLDYMADVFLEDKKLKEMLTLKLLENRYTYGDVKKR